MDVPTIRGMPYSKFFPLVLTRCERVSLIFSARPPPPFAFLFGARIDLVSWMFFGLTRNVYIKQM